jgi:hypothetical protein
MDANLPICEEINKHPLNRTGDNMEDVEQDNKPEYELQIWLAWTLY